jgi:ABC-type multidrug transport system ATPase subunit
MILTGIEKKLGSFFLKIDELAVQKPGVYGLIGSNGSGKTTIARIMAGIMEPDSGNVNTENLSYREITFLGRKPYMLNDTVYNNLVYPLHLRKIKPDPQLVEDYLEKMGLTERRNQKAPSLSAGEQQKLSFLRALIFKPRLIIADEALTAMDIDSLDCFENIILESQKKDPIIWILISHQMSQMKRLIDSIFFLHNGKLEARGSMEEVFSNSENPHIKQYLRAFGGVVSGITS